MDKKKTLLQFVFVAAIILSVFLAPSAAGGTTGPAPEKLVQMPVTPATLPEEGGSIKLLNGLRRATNSEPWNVKSISIVDRSTRYPNASRQIIFWKKTRDIVSAVATGIGDAGKQVIHTAGNLVSKVRQIKDNPITLVSEKILTNPDIARFMGVKYRDRAQHREGDVNVYLVDSKGLLGRIMDEVIGILGYPKAAGGTLYPVGIFINVPNLASDQYKLIENHEYCHYYQQSVYGFASWLSLYSSEILLTDLVNNDIAESYTNCSWEVAANRFAQIMVAG